MFVSWYVIIPLFKVSSKISMIILCNYVKVISLKAEPVSLCLYYCFDNHLPPSLNGHQNEAMN